MTETCWDHCRHCGQQVFVGVAPDGNRWPFSLCLHPSRAGEKRFEYDPVCELADPVPHQPLT